MSRTSSTIFSAVGTLALGALGLSLGTGCDTQAYCFDCGTGSSTASTGGSGTGGAGGGFMTSTGAFNTTTGSCGADTMVDLKNCGFCGNICNIANAFPKCEGGFCKVETCAPGWLDLDDQVTNGCEYQCTPSNGGVEICDDLDNDCNGQVDELFTKNTDKFNCGTCNDVCTFANAEPGCANSICFLDHCLVGFHDLDAMAANGCEYQCTPTNGSVEICDLTDNDCNGLIDEGIDTTVDVHNCGQCGTDCTALYPHATGLCQASSCSFGPCVVGFYDVDGNALNGCEYQCTPSNGGVEICDGIDNDCNGVKDDGTLPQVGQPCGMNNVGECLLGQNQCQNGSIVCANAVLPSTEYCDGLDNNCDATTDEGCPAALAGDIRLDLGAGSAVGQATSTQMHAAALGNVVFGAWLDRRAGNADIRGNVSIDGGVTWQTPIDVAVATTGAQQVEPWVTLSPTGAYVAFDEFAGAVRQIRVARSTASPFTGFAASVRVDHLPSSADSFYPRVVVANPQAASDDLVVVWQSITGSGTNVQTDVYLQRSLDGGATWLPSDLRVNSVAGVAEAPSLSTDGLGHAYIAWRDQRNSASEVFFDAYDVAAGTLAGNKPISAGNPSQDIQVVGASGNARVYVAWTDLRGSKSNIRVNSSANGGATFGADGTIVNPDSTFADASSPDLIATGARAFVGWEDTRSGKSDIRVNASADGGGTWASSTARADLGSNAGSSSSFEPKLAFGASSRLYVAWQDRRNGRGDIYVNHSFDLGVSFQPDDLRLDVGGPGAPSPLGAADSRSPFCFSTNGGARGVSMWIDNRTSTGTNGTFSDVYVSYIQ